MPKDKKSKRKRTREEDQETSEFFEYDDDSNSAQDPSLQGGKDELTSAVPAAAAVDVEAREEGEAEEDVFGAKDFRSQVGIAAQSGERICWIHFISTSFCLTDGASARPRIPPALGGSQRSHLSRDFQPSLSTCPRLPHCHFRACLAPRSGQYWHSFPLLSF